MKLLIKAFITASIGLLISSNSLADEAETSFSKNGEKATVSVQNPHNKPCYIKFRVEAYSKLISTGDAAWHLKLGAEWKLVANDGRSDELYESGATNWRINWISNECD